MKQFKSYAEFEAAYVQAETERTNTAIVSAIQPETGKETEMEITINHRMTGAVLWKGKAGNLARGVERSVRESAKLHFANLEFADLCGADLRDAYLREANLCGADLRDAYLREANLHGVNLRGANLRGADLHGANLHEANLQGADLRRANLRGADLREADLHGAYLCETDLREADLREANLHGVNLHGANLRFAEGKGFSDSTILDTGETWKEYLTEVVPSLLRAGGKLLETFGKSWNCHSWCNCPMAHAFGVTDIDKIPVLFQPRALQFVQLFDADFIPRPEGVPGVGCKTEKGLV